MQNLCYVLLINTNELLRKEGVVHTYQMMTTHINGSDTKYSK